MADPTLEVEGMENLRRLTEKAEAEVLGPPIRRLLEEGSAMGEAELLKRLPRDFTGTLRRRRNVRISGETLPLYGRVELNAPHVHLVNRGTKPHWPPAGSLIPWANARGLMLQGNNDFLLRRAIARRGTKGRNFLRGARASVRRKLPSLVQRAIQEIEARWGRKA